MDPSAPVTITLRDIYEAVSDLSAKVAPLPDQVSDHEARLRVLEQRPVAPTVAVEQPKAATTSGWTIASVIISAVVGLGSMLAVLITLMRVIPDIPA